MGTMRDGFMVWTCPVCGKENKENKENMGDDDKNGAVCNGCGIYVSVRDTDTDTEETTWEAPPIHFSYDDDVEGGKWGRCCE